MYPKRKLDSEERAELVKTLAESDSTLDFKTRLRNSGDFHKGSRKWGYRTKQQGIISFGRKKKNGCRLISTADIKRDERERQQDLKDLGCAAAFKPIKLTSESTKGANTTTGGGINGEGRQKWQIGDLAEILDERQKAKVCIIQSIFGEFATILIETTKGTDEIDVLLEDLF